MSITPGAIVKLSANFKEIVRKSRILGMEVWEDDEMEEFCGEVIGTTGLVIRVRNQKGEHHFFNSKCIVEV